MLEGLVRETGHAAQGDKEFNVEVAMLGRLQHPNIVRLLGACTEGPHRAAVFEHLACGSVRACLDGSPPLSWQSRLSIALDVARGLTHLHEVRLRSNISAAEGG